MANKIKDKTNNRYGRLLVVSKTYKRDSHGEVIWECDCDCGKKSILISSKHLIESGGTRSCGCLQSEGARKRIQNRALPSNKAAENRLFEHYNYSAKKRGIEISLTKDEMVKIIYQNCFYCGRGLNCCITIRRPKMGDVKVLYNGIDRIDSNGPYSKQNCVPCCKECNSAKMELTFDEFKNLIKCIALNLHLFDKISSP